MKKHDKQLTNDKDFKSFQLQGILASLIFFALLSGSTLTFSLNVILGLALSAALIVAFIVFGLKVYKQGKQKFGKAYEQRARRSALVFLPVYAVTFILLYASFG